MTGNHIVIIKLFKIKRFKTVKTIKTIRTIRTVRTATGEKKGPMALSFPPLPPILSLNIKLRVRGPAHAQFCSIEIKRLLS